MTRACLLLTLTLLACETGVSVELVDAIPFEPLPEYATYWQETEACSQRTGDLSLIQWFLASSILNGQAILRGLWQPPHRITIWRGLQNDPEVVKHEMLHDLLSGDPDHTDPAWRTCGLEPRTL